MTRVRLAWVALIAALLLSSCMTPQQSLREAQQLFDDGKNVKALQVLDRAMPRLEDSADAHALRGKLVDDDQAIKEYETAVRLDPSLGSAWRDLANKYYNRKDYARAQAAWIRHYELLKDRTASDCCKMSVVHFMARAYQQAFDAAAEGLRISPDHADAHFDAAMALRLLGRAKEALPHLDAVITKDREDAQAIFVRSLCYADIGDMDAAEDNDALIPASRNDFKTTSLAYQAYRDNRDFNALHAVLAAAFKKNDLLDTVLVNDQYSLPPDFRGLCMIEAARWRDAENVRSSTVIDLRNAAKNLAPDSAVAALARAVIAFGYKDLVEAKREAMDAMRRDPSLCYGATAADVAAIYAAIGDMESAFCWFLYDNGANTDSADRGLAARLLAVPAIKSANDAYARLFERSKAGQWPELVAAADECIRILPGFAQAHYYRAVGAYRLKDYAAAAESFTKAITLLPGFVDAYGMRSTVLVVLGKAKEAEEDTSLYIKCRPRAAIAYAQRSMLRLESLRNPAGALEDCMTALGLGLPAEELIDTRARAARAARLTGATDTAMGFVQALLADKKSEALGLMERGKLSCLAGDFPAAIKDFKAGRGTVGRSSDVESVVFEAWAAAETGDIATADASLGVAEYLGVGDLRVRPELYKARALVAAAHAKAVDLNVALKILLKIDREDFGKWFAAHRDRFMKWKDEAAFKGFPW